MTLLCQLNIISSRDVILHEYSLLQWCTLLLDFIHLFVLKIKKLSIKHYVFGTASAPVLGLKIRLRPTQVSPIGQATSKRPLGRPRN
jgi:hypothetical protein